MPHHRPEHPTLAVSAVAGRCWGSDCGARRVRLGEFRPIEYRELDRSGGTDKPSVTSKRWRDDGRRLQKRAHDARGQYVRQRTSESVRDILQAPALNKCADGVRVQVERYQGVRK